MMEMSGTYSMDENMRPTFASASASYGYRQRAVRWMRQVQTKERPPKLFTQCNLFSLLMLTRVLFMYVDSILSQIVTAFGISPNARDSAIQIFDRFLATACLHGNIVHHDVDFMSYVAAVALNLGYKLQESSRQLHLVR
jgi:hypothetical protein